MKRLFPDYVPAWETEDQAMLRAHAAEFFRREATPHQERWAEQHQVDRDFWRLAGRAGLLCPSLAEEHGGIGGDIGHEAVVTQELALALDTAVGLAVHTIVAHYVDAYGTEEQKRRWLPGLTSGELVGAVAMTEPDTGSDLQAVRTRASLEGGHYLLNGAKTFISNGSLCDLVVVVAKTDPAQRAGGISLLVAETAGLDGFARGRVLQKLGQHGQDTRELFFESVRIPASNLLGGEEGQGFRQLMQQLPLERLLIAIQAVAAAEAAVLEAIEYARERRVFGQPVLDFQNTRFVLADCKAEVLAGKTMVDHCIQQHIEGSLDQATASMAKLWCTEMQSRVTDRSLQVFGGYGYVTEYPIAQLYAAARVQRIYGGTNEIMKELIARSL